MKAFKGIVGALSLSVVLVMVLALPLAWIAPAVFAQDAPAAPAVSESAAPVDSAPSPAPPASAPADPVKASLIDRVLDAVMALLPGLMSFLAVYITKGCVYLWGKLSPKVAGSLSMVLGSAIAAVCAAIFPGVIPPDVAAALGAGGGLVSHGLTQTKPVETK